MFLPLTQALKSLFRKLRYVGSPGSNRRHALTPSEPKPDVIILASVDDTAIAQE